MLWIAIGLISRTQDAGALGRRALHRHGDHPAWRGDRPSRPMSCRGSARTAAMSPWPARPCLAFPLAAFLPRAFGTVPGRRQTPAARRRSGLGGALRDARHGRRHERRLGLRPAPGPPGRPGHRGRPHSDLGRAWHARSLAACSATVFAGRTRYIAVFWFCAPRPSPSPGRSMRSIPRRRFLSASTGLSGRVRRHDRAVLRAHDDRRRSRGDVRSMQSGAVSRSWPARWRPLLAAFSRWRARTPTAS